MRRNLVFLKLGGSLITVKDQPHTPRLEVLGRLASEIAEALAQNPELQILLGHGSGSFGHVPASKYKTRQGVQTAEEWNGFIEVWRQATELNHLVLQALEKADLPALALPPSAAVIAQHGKVLRWDLEPLLQGLKQGLLPVIHGDVVFDTVLGGTILSTEDLFVHLVEHIQPARLLFAGNEAGVWADFPANTSLLPEITMQSFAQVEGRLSGSAATDVTGGMADKVRQIIAMVGAVPGLKASIFTGEVAGNVRRALGGEALGTEAHN
ncbi:MAG TPA: isopentenyl phosphate kinase [Anaerolineales bacterium]